MRFLTLAAGGLILLLVVGVLWVDEGEVVTLTSVDDDGHPALTGLWIVEIDGTHYLRAVSEHAGWLHRLREHPEVELTRDGVKIRARATPLSDAATRNAVHWAMREKYGLVDAVLVRLIDHSHSVPIRVDLMEPVELAPPAPASGETHP